MVTVYIIILLLLLFYLLSYDIRVYLLLMGDSKTRCFCTRVAALLS